MADYISRDYTVENMENYTWDTEHDKNAAIHLVRELVPAADVRPVVRGKWIDKCICSNMTGYEYAMKCSNCGKPTYRISMIIPMPKYCQNCGADMREKAE